MSYLNTIQTWFLRECAGSIFLPDGWFGRPYDGLWSLVAVHESASMLILMLSWDTEFRFFDLKKVADGGNELIFSDFSKCEFCANRQEGNQPIIYTSGSVKILKTKIL